MADLRERLGRAVPPAGRRAARSVAKAVTTATSGLRLLPDFLIIGTQRGGTTTLYHYLTRHPQIAGAVLDKEVHFFDTRFDRGESWYRGRFPTRAGAALVRRRLGAGLIVGEASPYYLFHPLVPARVAALLPDVKLIAMLRDPVERAWSHYRHEVDLGYENLSFEEAIEREPDRLGGEAERILSDPGYVSFEHQHHSYLSRGAYAEQLPAWFEWFPRDRILLLRAEDFYADPGEGFRKVVAFLGAASWEPASYGVYNAASPTGMASGTRERLRAHFRPHNSRLAELTGRDFDWDG